MTTTSTTNIATFPGVLCTLKTIPTTSSKSKLHHFSLPATVNNSAISLQISSHKKEEEKLTTRLYFIINNNNNHDDNNDTTTTTLSLPFDHSLMIIKRSSTVTNTDEIDHSDNEHDISDDKNNQHFPPPTTLITTTTRTVSTYTLILPNQFIDLQFMDTLWKHQFYESSHTMMQFERLCHEYSVNLRIVPPPSSSLSSSTTTTTTTATHGPALEPIITTTITPSPITVQEEDANNKKLQNEDNVKNEESENDEKMIMIDDDEENDEENEEEETMMNQTVRTEEVVTTTTTPMYGNVVANHIDYASTMVVTHMISGANWLSESFHSSGAYIRENWAQNNDNDKNNKNKISSPDEKSEGEKVGENGENESEENMEEKVGEKYEVEIPAVIRGTFWASRVTTGAAATVSGAIVDGLVTGASFVVSNAVVPVITTTATVVSNVVVGDGGEGGEDGDKNKDGENDGEGEQGWFDATKDVAVATIQGVGCVLNAVSDSRNKVMNELADASYETVSHVYGPQAAQVSKDAILTVNNCVETVKNTGGLKASALARSVAKSSAKRAATDTYQSLKQRSTSTPSTPSSVSSSTVEAEDEEEEVVIYASAVPLE